MSSIDTALSPNSDAPANETEAWDNVKQIIGKERLTLGHHWSFNLRNDPRRFAFVLSRYKFAAKMAVPEPARDGGATRPKAHVLELGCSEGIGTPILAEFAQSYLGVDLDSDAIASASHNFAGQGHCRFVDADFLQAESAEKLVTPQGGLFDAVVSLDVVEHIMPDSEHLFFDAVAGRLTSQGIAVVGTPNKTADQYASPMSKAGHVNLFTGEHLTKAMRRVFRNVFLFGINDEIVHTGYTPMCHYIVALGCGRL